MTCHAVVIAAGPSSVQRLCCGTDDVGEISTIAMEAIDDPVALLDELPVAVDSLWVAALRQLAGGCSEGSLDGAVVLHPSWWSASRVEVVSAAATLLGTGVRIRPRSWLLARAGSDRPAALVEIADRLVALTVTGPASDVVALPRRMEPPAVAQDVAGAISTLTQGTVVVLDAPEAVVGATSLAALIADLVGSSRRPVLAIDDAGLKRLARTVAVAESDGPSTPVARPRVGTNIWAAAAGVVLTVLAATGAGAGAGVEPRRSPIAQPIPPTVLVEGRVALTIPAGWHTHRILVGPGSPRVQVTSPADAEVALHVTQSPTSGETLPSAADLLKRAIDAEPAGVFVDFNPSGVSAGRPAITYREVRATHDVRWTVLLDRSVRISVGCQSRAGTQDAVRGPCEEAVRSAHVLD